MGFFIWLGLFSWGTFWVMNANERVELILNAVAIVFVLDLDEMLFQAVTTSDVREKMDNLLPYFAIKEDLAEALEAVRQNTSKTSNEDGSDDDSVDEDGDDACRRRCERQKEIGIRRWIEIIFGD